MHMATYIYNALEDMEGRCYKTRIKQQTFISYSLVPATTQQKKENTLLLAETINHLVARALLTVVAIVLVGSFTSIASPASTSLYRHGFLTVVCLHIYFGILLDRMLLRLLPPRHFFFTVQACRAFYWFLTAHRITLATNLISGSCSAVRLPFYAWARNNLLPSLTFYSWPFVPWFMPCLPPPHSQFYSVRCDTPLHATAGDTGSVALRCLRTARCILSTSPPFPGERRWEDQTLLAQHAVTVYWCATDDRLLRRLWR